MAVKTLRKETADIIFACFFRNIWGHRSVLRSCRKFGRQSASPATSVIWPGKWKNAFCKDRAEKYCLELHKLLRNLLPFLGVFRLKSFKWLPGLLYFCSMYFYSIEVLSRLMFQWLQEPSSWSCSYPQEVGRKPQKRAPQRWLLDRCFHLSCKEALLVMATVPYAICAMHPKLACSLLCLGCCWHHCFCLSSSVIAATRSCSIKCALNLSKTGST